MSVLLTYTFKAIKDVHTSKDVLIELFGCMVYYFKRLEAYIKVRPTVAMRDIIIKIMTEVISILGIVTKEIWQGQTSMLFPVYKSPKFNIHIEKYFKKLLGMKDIEDSLQ
jgi:hypothetical protein